jgi:hypothetical protein
LRNRLINELRLRGAISRDALKRPVRDSRSPGCQDPALAASAARLIRDIQPKMSSIARP